MKIEGLEFGERDEVRVGIDGDGSGYMLRIESHEKRRIRNSGMYHIIDTGKMVSFKIAPDWMRVSLGEARSATVTGTHLMRWYDRWCADQEYEAEAAYVADLQAGMV